MKHRLIIVSLIILILAIIVIPAGSLFSPKVDKTWARVEGMRVVSKRTEVLSGRYNTVVYIVTFEKDGATYDMYVDRESKWLVFSKGALLDLDYNTETMQLGSTHISGAVKP